MGAGSVAIELREHRLAECQRIIDEVNAHFRQACEEADVPFKIEQHEGEPFRIAAERVRYHDLLVCGLGRLFEHGVIEEPPAEMIQLVQLGVRPLVAVAIEYRPIQRVLLAYSGSMESAKAMKRFVQSRLWPDAQLRIVTFQHAAEKATQLLADAADYCRAHGFQVETEYRADPAKQALLPYAAQWNADLIVMGNSARNMLLRRIFGETMLHTVAHADRPLFLAQ
jgi:nucleotide-binding universal stress UspA family protein